MRKDGSDSIPTDPPPPGGDVYAADTTVGMAPIEVLEKLRAPEQQAVTSPDDVDTIMLTSAKGPVPLANEPAANFTPFEDPEMSSDTDFATPSSVQPDVPRATAESAPSVGAQRRSWVLPILVLVLVCALMFVLGRLL